MASNFEIQFCGGTYEGGVTVHGFRGDKLTPKAATLPHVQSVTAVATCGSLLATGSADEVIRIFDLEKLAQVCELRTHTGTITALDFMRSKGGRPRYLLSGAADGKLQIWRCSDWMVAKEARAHGKRVADARFHPFGTAVISIGDDRKMRVWDVKTGDIAVRNFDDLPLKILISLDGKFYGVCLAKKIEIFETVGSARFSFQFPEGKGSFTTATFFDETSLVVGDSLGIARVIQVKSDSIQMRTELKASNETDVVGKSSRVKTAFPFVTPRGATKVAVLYTPGVVGIWDMATETLEGAFDLDVRVTSICPARIDTMKQRMQEATAKGAVDNCIKTNKRKHQLGGISRKLAKKEKSPSQKTLQ